MLYERIIIIIIINIIIIIIITFNQSSTGGLSLNSEWQQVSLGLLCVFYILLRDLWFRLPRFFFLFPVPLVSYQGIWELS